MTSPKRREELRSLLQLDDTNFSYFHTLYQKKLEPSGDRNYWIYEPGKTPPPGAVIVYPTDLIDRTPELQKRFAKSLKKVSYANLLSSGYAAKAREAAVWVKKMQAGTGSTLVRPIPPGRKKIGAKGTDLMIPLQGKEVSLAEVQVIRLIYEKLRGSFGEVIFHDVVSSETEESVQEIWRKKSLLDPKLSYEDFVSKTPGLTHFGKTQQQHVWTLDERGVLSPNRKAPAGHALFAQEALRDALHPERLPRTSKTLIAVVGNGEDLGMVDATMVGYILAEGAPITLITTDKTAVDAKGGILAVVDDGREPSMTIFETAQAQQAGQGALFKSLGGQINTNMAVFNYAALTPLLQKFIREKGEAEFEKSITPDLIQNWKSQQDNDGTTRKYLQLEGALGSAIMNLDRAWRAISGGTPLVHIVTVPSEHRTDFFAPVKTAFDYFMQFGSDRFQLIHDPGRHELKLKHLRRELPMVTLLDPATGDKYYQDLTQLLSCFRGTRILDLESLHVEGQVDFSNSTLKGKLAVTNRAGTRKPVSELELISKPKIN